MCAELVAFQSGAIVGVLLVGLTAVVVGVVVGGAIVVLGVHEVVTLLVTLLVGGAVVVGGLLAGMCVGG